MCLKYIDLQNQFKWNGCECDLCNLYIKKRNVDFVIRLAVEPIAILFAYIWEAIQIHNMFYAFHYCYINEKRVFISSYIAWAEKGHMDNAGCDADELWNDCVNKMNW